MFPSIISYQLINNSNLNFCPLEKPIVVSPVFHCQQTVASEKESQKVFAPSTRLEKKSAQHLFCEANNGTFNSHFHPLVANVNKQVGTILDQNNFRNVKPGDWIFFSHINQLTHLAISRLQTFFNSESELMDNITHVGVVTKVISSDVIKVAESPGYGYALAEKKYIIKELFNDEDVLFVAPSEIARTKKSSQLAQIIKRIGQEWIPVTLGISNQYNLKGLLKIPFSDNDFTDHDKKSIIEAFVDHIFNSPPQSDKNGILSNKPYFCSEFAQEVAQFSRFLEVNSINAEMIKKEISDNGLDMHSQYGRAQIVEYLEMRWEKVNLWKELLQDPLFSIPARVATPGALLDLALRHSSVIRVRNGEVNDRYEGKLTKEAYPEYVEYLSTKLLDRYLKGELISPEDGEIKKILTILENEMHYSRETLSCFIKDCYQVSNPLICIEKCLENTLSWQEKFSIFLLSREINRAVGQILHHPMFIEFLNNPYDIKWRDPSFIYAIELTVDYILSNVFPLTIINPFNSVENAFAKHFAKKLDKATLFKYIPLSLAYAPPSQEIKNFLNEENIPSEKIAEHFFHLFSMLQIKGTSIKSEQMKLVLKTLLKNGITQKEQSWMDPILSKVSKNSGYSKETLGCIGDTLSQSEAMSTEIEQCLKDTLSAQEKMKVFLSNQIITLGTENLLKNSQFKEFVRTGKIDQGINRNVGEQEFLNILYPTDTASYSESAQNYAAKIVCSKMLQGGLP
ncbi:MAG: hypothetical protein H0X29_10125, partial [Parachlamydiaceae bacterium]|nr:hypothetical protein [Parachlamydiaceae bacterium]